MIDLIILAQSIDTDGNGWVGIFAFLCLLYLVLSRAEEHEKENKK